MYFRLALRNVRKSYKDFLIYFLTLAFSVCLFYMFNSFQEQKAVMEVNQSQVEMIRILVDTMKYLSIFIAIVLAFLILYANNFLIRRRKKELGLYMLLGMPKGKISRILVYETVIIGSLSLVMGMFIGIFLSQILTTLTANMFEVPLDYHFIFSENATILTILSFGIIFAIVMLFNTLILNRYKLIDLLQADKVMEKLRVKNIALSIILFVVSIILIGFAYYKAIFEGSIEIAFRQLPFIIICGSAGTLLFFMSLTGLLLNIIKHSRSIYLRNLNSFILKQINANINTNFISMSIVCIMLLLSIGALSTGWNMNTTINKSIQNLTPFDYSLSLQHKYYDGSEKQTPSVDFEQEIQKMKLTEDSAIKSSCFTRMYLVSLQTEMHKLSAPIKDKELRKLLNQNADTAVMIVPLTDFNIVLEKIDKHKITLKNNETYLFTTMALFDNTVKDILKEHPTIKIFDKQFKVANEQYESPSLYTSNNIGYDTMLFVVPDAVIPKNLTPYVEAWNVDLKDPKQSSAFTERMDTKLSRMNKEKIPFIGRSAQDIKVMNKGMSIVFTYIGLYLGIVFMIASAIILALQQLSQANDNKKHYAILSKIGADERMMNHSILTQIGIYFMMPMLLAIIHCLVGIQMVNNLVMLFGKSDLFLSSLYTAGIIILIYGSYFAITYLGYKNILRS